MWKPWVVHASLWAYQTASVAVLIAVILLAGSAWVKTYRLYHRALVAVVAVGMAVLGLAGWFNDVLWHTTGVYVLAVSSYVLVRIRRILLALVLAFVWWIGIPLARISLEDQFNVRIPRVISQLARGLECRGYPRYFDSMMGTRLVVARADRSWIWDEVTEGMAVVPGAKDYGCRLGANGEVTFWYRDAWEYREVRKRVE